PRGAPTLPSMGRAARAPRAVRAAAVALALAAGTVVTAPPAGACACGGLVDGPAYDTSVSSETAVLQWDGTTQTVLLELDALSNAPEVGLILPTPAPAEVALADPEVFRELDALTAPRAVVSDHRWWPETTARGAVRRSEEHTSELQSRENLVCRLLLEKKKRNEC